MINTCTESIKRMTFSPEAMAPQGLQQTEAQAMGPLQQAPLDQARQYEPEQLSTKQACHEQLELLFEQRVRQFGRLQK